MRMISRWVCKLVFFTSIFLLFKIILVTSATSLIFCYVVFVPFAIYTFMWKYKSTIYYSYMEIVCAYGYSLAIFIPVSVYDFLVIQHHYMFLLQMLWVVQIQWFRWTLIIISVTCSGVVLINSFWPVVQNNINKMVGSLIFFFINLNRF